MIDEEQEAASSQPSTQPESQPLTQPAAGHQHDEQPATQQVEASATLSISLRVKGGDWSPPTRWPASSEGLSVGTWRDGEEYSPGVVVRHPGEPDRLVVGRKTPIGKESQLGMRHVSSRHLTVTWDGSAARLTPSSIKGTRTTASDGASVTEPIPVTDGMVIAIGLDSIDSLGVELRFGGDATTSIDECTMMTADQPPLYVTADDGDLHLNCTIKIPAHLGGVPPATRHVCSFSAESDVVAAVGTNTDEIPNTPNVHRCTVPATVQQVGKLHMTLTRRGERLTVNVTGEKGARVTRHGSVDTELVAARTTTDLGAGDEIHIGPAQGRHCVLTVSASAPAAITSSNPAAVRALMLTVPRAGENEISAQKRRRYDDKEDDRLRKHLMKQQQCFEKGAQLMAQLIERDIPTHIKRGAGRQVAGRTISSVKDQTKQSKIHQQRGNRATKTSASKVQKGLEAVALGRRIAQHQHTSHTGHRQSADKAAHHGHLGGSHICRHHLRPGGCARRLNGNSYGPRCTFQHPDLRDAGSALKNAKRAARRRQGTPVTGGAGKHEGGGGSRVRRGHGEAISMGKRRGRGGRSGGSGNSRGAGGVERAISKL